MAHAQLETPYLVTEEVEEGEGIAEVVEEEMEMIGRQFHVESNSNEY
jgi:anthranilate/para-aminobenzoate synthase component II